MGMYVYVYRFMHIYVREGRKEGRKGRKGKGEQKEDGKEGRGGREKEIKRRIGREEGRKEGSGGRKEVEGREWREGR